MDIEIIEDDLNESIKNRNIFDSFRKFIIFSIYIFTGNETSSFENFSSGLLVGLSIGCI